MPRQKSASDWSEGLVTRRGRQKTVEVTVFNPSNVFVTLSTIPFQETAPLARALRSTSVEQSGFDVLNQVQQLTIPGFTSDVPGINARPIQLALDNILLLSSLTAQLETRLEETRREALNVRETLQDAIKNDDLNIFNGAESTLETSLLAQFVAAAEETNLLESTSAEAVAVPRLKDFTYRPNEAEAFTSAVYTGRSFSASLFSNFISRVSLSAGQSVSLSELLLANSSANATSYAISIKSEIGGTPVATLSATNPTDLVYTDTAITEAIFNSNDLSQLTITAGSGGLGAQDFISIVELGNDGAGTNTRGAFQTISFTSSAAVQDGVAGSDGSEAYRKFNFLTESETAFSSLRLQISGLDIDTTATDTALKAILAGDLRIQVLETLIDGNTNLAQLDRLNSTDNTLIFVFPFQFAGDGVAQNGLTVEARTLDAAYDVSNLQIRVEFP